MRIDRWGWILVCAFLVLACATRFCRLDWSFSEDLDEIATFAEARSLTDKPFFVSDLKPYDRLPRAHPVAYGLQLLTYRAFGQGEFGARVGAATAGALSIALIVLLTHLLFGRLSAIFVGILLVLWPWHVLYSQCNRMYIYAFLFASVAILSGALAWKENSFVLAIISAIASALAISSHNLTIAVPASFFVYAVAERLMGKGSIPARAATGYALVGVPLMTVSGVLAFLAMRGWAEEMDWGYTSLHSLMGLAYNLQWHMALLAAVGAVAAWVIGNGTMRLFAVIAGVSVAMCLILPRIASFRHDYVFPLSVVFVLLAGYALTTIFSGLASQSRLLAWSVVAALLLLALPSFASYYQDGGRKDYRGAAQYIKSSWQDGDLVAADSPGTLGRYLPYHAVSVPGPTVNAKACISKLEEMLSTGCRVWYVCRYAREEPAPWADQWLWSNGVRMARFKKPRFDYEQNILDVYLLGRPPKDVGKPLVRASQEQ